MGPGGVGGRHVDVEGPTDSERKFNKALAFLSLQQRKGGTPGPDVSLQTQLSNSEARQRGQKTHTGPQQELTSRFRALTRWFFFLPPNKYVRKCVYLTVAGAVSGHPTGMCSRSGFHSAGPKDNEGGRAAERNTARGGRAARRERRSTQPQHSS